MERAAFHEASHAVSIWALGGTVVGVEIAYDDATTEWQGMTVDQGLPNDSAKIEVWLAGGLGEALYVANVYDSVLWRLEEPLTNAALLAPVAGPFALINITFADPAGAAKVIQFDRDTFSNDLHRAQQLAQQQVLALPGLLTNTINRLNTPAVWDQIVHLASRFLLCPPRILTWRYGIDAQIDPDKAKYRIAPLEAAAKQALGIQ
jgi:hypothetical protein